MDPQPRPSVLRSDAAATRDGDCARSLALIERQLAMTERLAEIGLSIAEVLERQALRVEREAEAGVAAAEAQKQRAEQAPEQASEPAPPQPSQPPRAADFSAALDAIALAHARTARSVRVSLALQTQLMRAKAQMASAAEFETKQATGRAARRLDVEEEQRRNLVGRIVWRVACEAEAQETEGDLAAERDRDGRGEGLERPERPEGPESTDYPEHCEREAVEWLKDEDLYGDVLARPVSETVARVCRDLGLSPDWPALADQAWARAEKATGAVGAPLAAVWARDGDPPDFIPEPVPDPGSAERPAGLRVASG